MSSRNDDQLGNEEPDWMSPNWMPPNWTLFRKKYSQEREVVAIWEHQAKSNWMSALVSIASALATVGTLLFGIYQFNAQQAANVQLQVTQAAAGAQLQATQEAASATQTVDQQRQTTFDTYLDRMSDLLLFDNLQTSKPGSSVRAVAEARTIATLRDLYSTPQAPEPRAAELVRFLWKAGLVTGEQPIISLNAAPLEFTKFQNALLYNINLSGALLNGDIFNNCDLQGAIFIGTNLTAAILENVNLTGMNMTKALLQRAILSGDDLTKVNLTGANLTGADLKGALITPAQLKQVASLQGAIMPDGSKHP